MGYTVVDPPSIIATHLTEVIRQHIAELLTRQDVQNLINNIKDNNSALIDELVPKLLGIGEIQKVLQNLLEEGISIRDLVTIFETLADHAAVTRDTDILTEYVRQSLKRAISENIFHQMKLQMLLHWILRLNRRLWEQSRIQNRVPTFHWILPVQRQSWITGRRVKRSLRIWEKNPIVITSPIVRLYFKKLASDYYKDIIVISYNEVESNIELQSVGW